MEVYKRPNSPSWYVDLVHPGTGARKRTSLRFTGTKVQAQRKGNTLQAQMEQETASGISETLQAAVDDFIGHLKASGKVSYKQAEHTRNKLFGLSVGTAGRYHMSPSKFLHTLTPADVEALVRARQTEGNKPQTIAHEVGLLRSAVHYARGLGKRVPMDMLNGSIKNPFRAPKVAMKTRWLAPEEWSAVYAYLDPDRPVTWRTAAGGSAQARLTGTRRTRRQDTRDLFVALTLCGGRWSEVAGLTWDRVDLQARTVRLWGNKTKQERLVPLPEQFLEVLQRRWETRGENNLVFPTPDGEARKGSNRGIGKAMDACGLNAPALVAVSGKATVHTLRHTFASWLVQRGAGLAHVQDALGHSSILMTRRYATLAKAETVVMLGEILSEMRGTA